MDGAPGIKTWHDVGAAEIEPEKKAASSRAYRFGLVYGYVTRYASEHSCIRIVHGQDVNGPDRDVCCIGDISVDYNLVCTDPVLGP